MSFYAKSNGSRNIGLRTGITGTATNIIFNPNTQAVVSLPSGFTANITSANDGYYRYSITVIASASSDLLSVVMFSGTSLVYTGSGQSVYISAIQTEQGTYATTYIPTTTAAVTRIADVANKTGISSLIGQTAGTIFADLSYIATSTASARWFNVFGTTQHIALASNGINQIRVITNALSDTLSTAPTSNTGIKIAFAYNNSGVVCFINGTQYTLTNGGGQVMTSLTSIAFDLSLATGVVEAKINQSALFPTRLTNAQLAQLTTL